MSKSAQTIPKGYRQTEVGVIPVDWEVMPLGDLADVSAGGTPSRSVSEYWDGDIPWVTTTEVNFGRITSTEQNISELGLKNSAAKLLRPGTILLALYGQGKTRGKVAILDIEATSNQACAAIVLTTKVSQRFILNYLAGRYEFIRSLSNTGNQENLNGIIVKSIPIPLPPTLAEQEAIADALSDADGQIESLEKLIAKKRQIKQGTMQELLTGQRRLPGFSGEWETKRLGEIIDLLTGFPFPSSGYSQSGIRLLRGSNVKRNRTDWADDITQYWPEVHGELRRFLLKSGDIVIAMDGSLVGRSFASLKDDDVPSLLLQRVARIRSEVVSQDYLKEWICSQYFTEHCDSVKTTTAIPHISPADINSFQIRLSPTLAEQTAIAAILSDMDAEIAALESKLAKARQVKQGMMQELLTGRIRLV